MSVRQWPRPDAERAAEQVEKLRLQLARAEDFAATLGVRLGLFRPGAGLTTRSSQPPGLVANDLPSGTRAARHRSGSSVQDLGR